MPVSISLILLQAISAQSQQLMRHCTEMVELYLKRHRLHKSIPWMRVNNDLKQLVWEYRVQGSALPVRKNYMNAMRLSNVRRL